MNKIVINLENFEGKRSFHRWLKEQCHFPSYYGCNLDALYDCLSENPCFVFEVIDSQKYAQYQKQVVATIQDAGCEVNIIQEEMEKCQD